MSQDVVNCEPSESEQGTLSEDHCGPWWRAEHTGIRRTFWCVPSPRKCMVTCTRFGGRSLELGPNEPHGLLTMWGWGWEVEGRGWYQAEDKSKPASLEHGCGCSTHFTSLGPTCPLPAGESPRSRSSGKRSPSGSLHTLPADTQASQQVCGPPALLHLTSLGWSSCSSSVHCDCWGCSWLSPTYTEIPEDQELCLWVPARTPTPHPYTYQFLAPTKCLVNMGWTEDG